MALGLLPSTPKAPNLSDAFYEFFVPIEIILNIYIYYPRENKKHDVNMLRAHSSGLSDSEDVTGQEQNKIGLCLAT